MDVYQRYVNTGTFRTINCDEFTDNKTDQQYNHKVPENA